jgi:diguanylate cyclase (GGDEF)-like protein
MTSWAFEELPYQLPFLLSAAAAGFSAREAWRRRPAPGSTAGVVLLAALAVWALAYAIELACDDLAVRQIFTRIEYLGVVIAPPAFFTLARGAAGLPALRRGTILALLVVPALTLLQVVSGDPFHGVWVARELVQTSPVTVVRSTYGAWFWLYYVFACALFVGGSLHLVRASLQSLRFYRMQMLLLLGGVSVPWMVNLLYILRVPPFHTLDWTSAGFTVTGVLAVWSLERFRLFDLVPVARDRVLEAIDDGVLVLDDANRIVDLNAAAARWLGREPAAALGLTLAEAFPQLGPPDDTAFESTRVVEIGALGGGTIEVRIQPLRDAAGRTRGKLMVCRDRTESKRVEERLRYLSSHDTLTDLYNRAHFDEALGRLRRDGPFPTSVILADIDDLKVVNDERGHEAGDDLLRRTAAELRDCFRSADLVARIGGDEFAVLLPGADARVAHDLVDRAARHLRTLREVSGPPGLSLSLGAATAHSAAELDEALRAADRAMYAAKRAPGAPA